MAVMSGEMLGLPLWNVVEGTAGVNKGNTLLMELLMKSGLLGRFYINAGY